MVVLLFILSLLSEVVEKGSKKGEPQDSPLMLTYDLF